MAIHKIKIFTGRDSEYLAKKIAASSEIDSGIGK